MTLSNKITRINVSEDITLLQAMQKMDANNVKLLLILENYTFKGLISIGDIQRAIINNFPIESKISQIKRKNVTVCNSTESIEIIKQKMFHLRTEYMPVIDEDNQIVEIHFWDDLFENESEVSQFPLPIPVVVMAGGFGSRLKPLTNVIPKPLIPIGEKTILEEIVGKFTKLGSTEFFFTVNYKSELIKFYFDQITDKNYSIDYLLEDKPLGTAGSLYLAKGKIHSTFFVTNCDIIIDDDYVAMYQFHKEQKNDITLVASIKHLKIPYGTVESGENGELIALKEKPEVVFKINTGMYILEPHLLNTIEDNTHIHITELIENVKQNGGKVGVFPISEKSWYDIGEWKEYQKIIDKYK
jgi:dTDP-glucose pyrophosphorylase